MGTDGKTKAEDAELFRRSVGDVRRLSHGQVEPRLPRRLPIPEQSLAEERVVLAEMAAGEMDPAELETGEELIYRGAGLQERRFRKLRRGMFAVEAELDLHGMTTDAARDAVADFVTRARLAKKRCVRIIHGKGLRSRGGRPVIKSGLQRWLRQRKDVLGFCSARPVDGGTGALYVLIKRGN